MKTSPGEGWRAAFARAALLVVAVLPSSCDSASVTRPTCGPATRQGSGAPRLVRNLSIGNTGWFSSPAVVDLDGDGAKEIVAPFYDIAVWSADGHAARPHGRGRLASRARVRPEVVADLDGDTTVEIVVASGRGR